jgi:hypothetical protein
MFKGPTIFHFVTYDVGQVTITVSNCVLPTELTYGIHIILKSTQRLFS